MGQQLIIDNTPIIDILTNIYVLGKYEGSLPSSKQQTSGEIYTWLKQRVGDIESEIDDQSYYLSLPNSELLSEAYALGIDPRANPAPPIVVLMQQRGLNYQQYVLDREQET